MGTAAEPRERWQVEQDERAQARWSAEIARLELQLGHLREAVAREQAMTDDPGGHYMQVPVPVASPRSPSGGDSEGRADIQLKEMFHELESLEIALMQERQKNNVLTEEKATREAAHSRDIAELEGMLKQATSENERLIAENRRLLGEVASLRAGVKETSISAADLNSTTSYTASEPEIERSGEFDIDRLSRLGLSSSPRRSLSGL
mmetsp:Transcript_19096/g.43376  ORF Transcript_19096/g.43376 Transcript_19096/m.43376 type:complete len:206 (+) Transcript_19096:88-705(+)